MKTATKQYQILNSKGLVIGIARASSPEAAVQTWNRVNQQAKEFATEAIESPRDEKQPPATHS